MVLRAIYDDRMSQCSTLNCLEKVLEQCYEACDHDDECEIMCRDLFEIHARRFD